MNRIGSGIILYLLMLHLGAGYGLWASNAFDLTDPEAFHPLITLGVNLEVILSTLGAPGGFLYGLYLVWNYWALMYSDYNWITLLSLMLALHMVVVQGDLGVDWSPTGNPECYIVQAGLGVLVIYLGLQAWNTWVIGRRIRHSWGSLQLDQPDESADKSDCRRQSGNCP